MTGKLNFIILSFLVLSCKSSKLDKNSQSFTVNFHQQNEPITVEVKIFQNSGQYKIEQTTSSDLTGWTAVDNSSFSLLDPNNPDIESDIELIPIKTTLMNSELIGYAFKNRVANTKEMFFCLRKMNKTLYPSFTEGCSENDHSISINGQRSVWVIDPLKHLVFIFEDSENQGDASLNLNTKLGTKIINKITGSKNTKSSTIVSGSSGSQNNSLNSALKKNVESNKENIPSATTVTSVSKNIKANDIPEFIHIPSDIKIDFKRIKFKSDLLGTLQQKQLASYTGFYQDVDAYIFRAKDLQDLKHMKIDLNKDRQYYFASFSDSSSVLKDFLKRNNYKYKELKEDFKKIGRNPNVNRPYKVFEILK